MNRGALCAVEVGAVAVDSEHQHVIAVETGVLRLEVIERARQQPGHRDHDDAERHLDHD